jgi:hypothetical protein
MKSVSYARTAIYVVTHSARLASMDSNGDFFSILLGFASE